MDDIAVYSPPDKLHRSLDIIVHLKHLIVVNEQCRVRRQNGGSKQAHVAHIGIPVHGQQPQRSFVQPRAAQYAGYLPQIARRKEVGFRAQSGP